VGTEIAGLHVPPVTVTVVGVFEPLAYEMLNFTPAAPLSPALQISSVPFAAEAMPAHNPQMRAVQAAAAKNPASLDPLLFPPITAEPLSPLSAYVN
jgi:hypothetical protein